MTRSLKNMIRGKKGTHLVGAQASEQGTQTTFIIEALLLLICLMMVIAVSVAVIAYSVQANNYYSHKEAAITFGGNVAEIFAADPESLQGDYEEGDLIAVCDVDSYHSENGTLYNATISVEWNEQELYQIETSRYISERQVR